jgi:hypothetical protein
MVRFIVCLEGPFDAHNSCCHLDSKSRRELDIDMLSSSCELGRNIVMLSALRPASLSLHSAQRVAPRRVTSCRGCGALQRAAVDMLSSSCELGRNIVMLSRSELDSVSWTGASSTSTCELDRHIEMLSSSGDFDRHIDMLSSSCDFDRHIDMHHLVISTDTSTCYHHLVSSTDTPTCYHHLVSSTDMLSSSGEFYRQIRIVHIIMLPRTLFNTARTNAL